MSNIENNILCVSYIIEIDKTNMMIKRGKKITESDLVDSQCCEARGSFKNDTTHNLFNDRHDDADRSE